MHVTCTTPYFLPTDYTVVLHWTPHPPSCACVAPKGSFFRMHASAMAVHGSSAMTVHAISGLFRGLQPGMGTAKRFPFLAPLHFNPVRACPHGMTSTCVWCLAWKRTLRSENWSTPRPLIGPLFVFAVARSKHFPAQNHHPNVHQCHMYFVATTKKQPWVNNLHSPQRARMKNKHRLCHRDKTKLRLRPN